MSQRAMLPNALTLGLPMFTRFASKNFHAMAEMLEEARRAPLLAAGRGRVLRQLLADGGRPAGPPPLPAGDAGPGAAVEVDRLVATTGLIGLAGRRYPVGSQFAGRRLTVRLDRGLLQLVDQGVLLRSLPNPLTPAEQARLRGESRAVNVRLVGYPFARHWVRVRYLPAGRRPVR